MSDLHDAILEDSSTRTTACPDFEDLSRFVDGELDERRSEGVHAHTMECTRCSRLVTVVGTWLEAAAPADSSIGDSNCASMELLVGYLTGGLSNDDHQSVDNHVRGCDECIRTLTLLHTRLGCASEVDALVPAAVLARAAAVMPGRVRAGATALDYDDWSEALAAVGGRLSDALKLPVLIPAAVAAGALLIVAERQLLVNPSPVQELSRSAPMPQKTLRVTAPEAMVYAEPSTRTSLTATITRGTTVTVGGQEREWYRVALADGKEGWVERRAFE